MIRILLAGEGGQGVQTVAKVLTTAAQTKGMKTSYLPSFGVEQRGGVSLAYIQVAEENIPYPRFEEADIIVSFCDRSIAVIKDFVTDQTAFIYDSSAICDIFLCPIKSRIKEYIALPFQKIAQEKYSTKILNMIILGSLARYIDLDEADVEAATIKTLGEKFKTEEIKKMNLDAIAEGAQMLDTFNPQQTDFTGIEKQEPQLEWSDDKKTWTRFPEYCKGCALCIVRCPVKALKFSKEIGFLGNPMPEVDIDKCIACGMCEKTCPDGAIKVDKKL